MKRILVVDDEKDFCYFVKKNLEASGGFEVTVCYDGIEGIKMAKALHPDLILLDIVMPGTDGSDVAAELRDDEATQDIPVVFLTAMVKEKETEKEKHFIGGWRYVAKPVKINELIATINSITG